MFAIDSETGTQRWRHRLTEFGDPEDPSETTRPTEPILGVNQTNSSIIVTGGGFYSSIVAADDGTQLYELPSAGVGSDFGDADSQFYHPASVTLDGMIYTYSHDVIQGYRFDEADTVDEAEEWVFGTTDMIHTNPVLWENEGCLVTTDSRARVCFLDLSTGSPEYTYELDNSAEKFVPTQQGVLVDTKSATYLVKTET